MNSAILYLTHVQDLTPFLICHIVTKTIFKDLIEVFMQRVTNDKVKQISHLTTHHATEDVLDSKYCLRRF